MRHEERDCYGSGFHRLLDRQVCRLSTLEKLTGVASQLTEYIGFVRSVRHQTAGRDKLARGVARGYRIFRRQRQQTITPAEEGYIGGNEQRSDPPLSQADECRFEVALGGHLQDQQFPAERGSSLPRIPDISHRIGIVG